MKCGFITTKSLNAIKCEKEFYGVEDYKKHLKKVHKVLYADGVLIK